VADSTLSFLVDGRRYDVTFEDLTAADAGDFRKAVGMPLSALFGGEVTPDIDAIAGLVWLVRRKQERQLSYRVIAESLNYGNVAPVEDDAPVEAEDPHDPE
jgi:hypothetical protein